MVSVTITSSIEPNGSPIVPFQETTLVGENGVGIHSICDQDDLIGVFLKQTDLMIIVFSKGGMSHTSGLDKPKNG